MRGLKYFMLSHQSLMLYRDFMKIIAKIPDQETQSEIKSQVKNDFIKYRQIEDLSQMEYLIVTGRKQLKQL